MAKIKPQFRVEIDTGDGEWLDVSTHLSTANVVSTLQKQSNTSTLTFRYNIKQQIPDLGTKDRVRISARYEDDNPAWTYLFEGYLTTVNFDTLGHQCELYAEDYTRFLLDRLITDAWTNTKAVDILKGILNEWFADDLQWDITTIEDDDFVIPDYAYEEKNAMEVIEYLAELVQKDFWIEPDTAGGKPVFYLKTRAYDETVKETLTAGQNISSLVAIEDRQNMWNDIILAGDARQFQTQESFIASGVQSEFLLTFKPHATYVEVNGVPKKGGIAGASIDPDYTVDFWAKKITFTAANIPPAGAIVSCFYSYDVPIKVQAEDGASILRYGRKTQVIKNKNIVGKDEALQYARAYLDAHKYPVGITNVDAPALLTFKVGDTIRIIDTEKAYDVNQQVIEINYEYTKSAGFKMGVKTQSTLTNSTDSMKEIIKRLKQLEEIFAGQVETITKVQSFVESIIIRIKRTKLTCKSIPKGFLWSTKGAHWTGNNNYIAEDTEANTEWGIATPASSTVCFDIGDAAYAFDDFATFLPEGFAFGKIAADVGTTLFWTLHEPAWNHRSWSGRWTAEPATPTTRYITPDVDSVEQEENTVLNLSIPLGFEGTLWSLSGGSPPLWNHMGWHQKPEATPTPSIVHSEIASDIAQVYERLTIDLTDSRSDRFWVWNKRTWNEDGWTDFTGMTPIVVDTFNIPQETEVGVAENTVIEITDNRGTRFWVWNKRVWNTDGWTDWQGGSQITEPIHQKSAADAIQSLESMSMEIDENYPEVWVANRASWNKDKWTPIQ
jgi:hypothetical protein